MTMSWGAVWRFFCQCLKIWRAPHEASWTAGRPARPSGSRQTSPGDGRDRAGSPVVPNSTQLLADEVIE